MMLNYNPLGRGRDARPKNSDSGGPAGSSASSVTRTSWWLLYCFLFLFTGISAHEGGVDPVKKSSNAVTTCAGATVLSAASLPITNQALICGATNDLNATNVAAVCGGASNNYKGGIESLYSLTPTVTNDYTISIAGQTWTSIFVYAGCPTSGGTCVNSIGNSSTSKNLTVNLTAGVEYFIWFDTWPTPDSPCPGTFSIVPFVPLANDTCITAITLDSCSGSPQSITGTTTGSGVDPGYQNCGAEGGVDYQRGVWYKYIGDDNQVTITTCDAVGYDSRLTVYSGSCGTFTCMGGNDDMTAAACPASTVRSAVTFNALTGTDYYIFVHGFQSGTTLSATGDFVLSWSCTSLCTPATSNDECATAVSLTLGSALATNNTCATPTVMPVPTCGATFGTHYDSWYSFNSGSNTSLEFFANYGPPATVGLAMYSGACGTLTQVACSATGAVSSATVTENTDYFIRAFSLTPETRGAFSLNVRGTCTNATGINVTDISSTEATLNWTASTANPTDGYQYEIRTSGDAGSGATGLAESGSLVAGSTSVEVSGLTSGTDYNAYIRAVCGTDYESEWSAAVPFSTIAVSAPPCATDLSPADLATDVSPIGTLTWTASPSATGYTVFFGATAESMVEVSTDQPGTSYVPSMMPNTQYFWQIVPSNGVGPAIGCAIQSFTTGAPVYCAAAATSTSFEKIANVTFNEINNNSSATVGYEDFTSISTPAMQGSTQSFSATISNPFNADQILVWIDYNQDGDFSDEGELVYTSLIGVGPHAGDITIPVDASVGTTRMRVRLHDTSFESNSTPCGNSTFGQVEDYTINILEMSSDVPLFYNLQWPPNAGIAAGSTFTAYAQVWAPGVTDAAGQGAGIQAWIGVSPEGDNSDPATWTMWAPAVYNVDAGNNDEYMGTTGNSLPAGTYYYASRFSLNGGPMVYGGYNGGAWNGTTNVSGVLTVSANPTECASNFSPANGAVGVPVGPLTLSWDAPANGAPATSYDIYEGPSGNLVFFANTTDTFINVNVSGYSNTFYWRVVPKSPAGGEAIGCTELNFTTEADPFAPYCSGVSYTSAVEPITSVSFAGINNQSSAQVLTAANGGISLENFISETGNVTTESTYEMILKGNTDGIFTNNFRVFIDWNQDGAFSASETYNAGTINTSNGEDAIQAVSNITVPADALAGSTRMRIKKLFGTANIDNACVGGGFGQSEDYTINVTLCPQTEWYADVDGDGYGDASNSVSACSQPTGYVTSSDDCDDTNADVNPEGTEILYNGLDDNCDGTIDEGSQITTNVRPNQCGSTLAHIYTSIQAFPAANATAYRFRISGPSGIQYSEQTNPWFQLTSLANYNYGTTYSIDVEIQRNGIWLGYYGTACNVSTPSLPAGSLSVSQCGGTLANVYSSLNTAVVPGATMYRFSVTNLTDTQGPFAVQQIDRNVPWFKLTQLDSYDYGKSYQIEVAVKTTGEFSAFGSPCVVTTPVRFSSANQCGLTYSNIYSPINASIIPNVSGYRFRVTNQSTNSVQEILPAQSWITFSQVIDYSPNTAYSIEIAVRTTGDFGPYGPACTINSAASGIAASGPVTTSEFKAVASPNPYTDTFAINITSSAGSPVEVRVYDMIGKLLEVRAVQPSDVESQSLGNGYPSGVYNVIVTQDDTVKTLRVIKR